MVTDLGEVPAGIQVGHDCPGNCLFAQPPNTQNTPPPLPVGKALEYSRASAMSGSGRSQAGSEVASGKWLNA